MKPTVGRVVYFHNEVDGAECAAIVVHVWNDSCVNLVVFDHNGVGRGVTSVTQGDQPRQWDWMIYQKEQAQKAEELEKQLAQNDAPCQKTMDISEVKGAKANIKDLVVYGDGDTFALLCKASSQKEGWMKSTKVCNVEGGCIVQVTTQQKNSDGSYAVAEALSYVPGVHIDRELSPRRLVSIYKK
jgi:hypothetical protein